MLTGQPRGCFYHGLLGMSCVVSVDKAETNFEFSNKGTLYATRNVFVILIHSLLSVIFMI